MYEAKTNSIRVRVTPRFLEEQSTPEDGRYFWAYTVEIANDGTETVQLKTRRWLIVDANGHSETVQGPGVIGKTPTLTPGASFTYTSGCPLTTPSGMMSGSYQMQLVDGRFIDVEIPGFSLDSPYGRRSIN
ncbi:MAG: Co2+/Mg2+ efflux protein ApaG [Hyphomicrobiaceae bacterium]